MENIPVKKSLKSDYSWFKIIIRFAQNKQ